MRFFGKKRAPFVGPDGTEYAVLPTDQVEPLVGSLGDRTAARLEEPVPPWVNATQLLCFARVVGQMREVPEPTNDQVRWARTAAKLGYEARVVEFGDLDTDDHNDELTEAIWLSKRKETFGAEWFQAIGGMAHLLLKLSIEKRYEPDAASLLAPIGLGHDIHTEMSVDLIGRIVATDEDEMRDLEGVISLAELGQCWRYGYYVRACEMSLPDEARSALADVAP